MGQPITFEVCTTAPKLRFDAGALKEASESAAKAALLFAQEIAKTEREIARMWLDAHPGRRLPGGHTNERMRNKRSKALWAWFSVDDAEA